MFELHRFLFVWERQIRMMKIIQANRLAAHPFDFAGLIVHAA
jgi:hypothetical protein